MRKLKDFLRIELTSYHTSEELGYTISEDTSTVVAMPYNLHCLILLNQLEGELGRGYKFQYAKSDVLKTLVTKVAYFIDDLPIAKSSLTLTSNSLFFTFYLPNDTYVDFEVMYKNKINVEVFYSLYQNDELVASDYGSIDKCLLEIKSLISEDEPATEVDSHETRIPTDFKVL